MTKGKPRVIVMTKIDLCDNVKTNKWIKYYEDRDYIVVPIDLINNLILRLYLIRLNL